jgi:excisionase family DNA binding protein
LSVVGVDLQSFEPEVLPVPTVYLTTAEAGEVLNVTRATVIAYCKQGQLEHVRLNRQYRIPESALVEFAAGRTVEADAQRMLDLSIAEGTLPAEPPPEVLGRIAEILRQHYAEQAERTAS